MVVAKLGAVVVDCPDPLALATFYGELLGATPVVDDETWVDLAGYEGTPLAFQLAPGHVPPRWPSPEGSQQFHLDLTVEDLDAAEERILALGATPLDTGDKSRTWRVYADPAGHPVCLCAG
ncbi:VOC family protein [Streptomyces goshikiensis]|uniref:VOC family protein n=1 Tax=Streptomyces goshikiensis TaxID=1942 RepID=A0ABZ1RP87_9ACTN|nr:MULTISPECIES: VOC family protein [Streptomyces]MBP0934595.1 VOC family protein [Streptomyces sp. KCTC 0041BP]OKI34661.1 glyoxalase [Streptomyces sp. CB03578]PJN15594.1 VOC family protein [Streptomyces sp. CB02120-2]GHD79120.1 glyoxalase [Streptomyces goshikiensis]